MMDWSVLGALGTMGTPEPVHLPPHGGSAVSTYAASWPHTGQPGKGWCFTEGRNPLRLDSPCGLLTKPRVLGVCVPLTSTFQGQLFHSGRHLLAATPPTVHRLPAQPVGVLTLVVPPFHPRASWRTHRGTSLILAQQPAQLFQPPGQQPGHGLGGRTAQRLGDLRQRTGRILKVTHLHGRPLVV